MCWVFGRVGAPCSHGRHMVPVPPLLHPTGKLDEKGFMNESVDLRMVPKVCVDMFRNNHE